MLLYCVSLLYNLIKLINMNKHVEEASLEGWVFHHAEVKEAKDFDEYTGVWCMYKNTDIDGDPAKQLKLEIHLLKGELVGLWTKSA